MTNYIQCPNCGQQVWDHARVCPYCGDRPPTDVNMIEAGFNSSPYAIAGGGFGFGLGGILFAVFGVSIFKAIILSLVAAVVATAVVCRLSLRAQQLAAILVLLPFVLGVCGGFIWFALQVLKAFWSA